MTFKETLHRNGFQYIILIANGASGKTHLANQLEQICNLKQKISDTTRPPRTNEIDGVDYNFIDDHVFRNTYCHGLYVETAEFNKWKYGTPISQLVGLRSLVLTPSGIIDLQRTKLGKKVLDKSLIIFIEIDQEIRRQRLSKRSDADSVERRLFADSLDFSNEILDKFLTEKTNYIVINNPKFDLMQDGLYDNILKLKNKLRYRIINRFSTSILNK